MSNDEKIFNLMEKMYGEIIGLKEGQKSLDQGQNDINEELSKLSQAMARIENDHGEKLSVLFDAIKQHDDRFDRLDAKSDRHEIENAACFNRLEKKLDVVIKQVAGHEEKLSLIR